MTKTSDRVYFEPDNKGIFGKEETMASDLELAKSIAQKVCAEGGRTFFVGGFVRDRLMGRPSKDVDLEVHGIPPEHLAAILDGIGRRTVMGASFGVYGLAHSRLDIAMPRMERATGRGHRDFEVSVDPFIGPEKAAIRRDFTVNAMMEDVLTGEVVDPFGGREDLARGILRHVNDRSFPEDSLRVLRAAQFAARFGFSVAPETVRLCAGMDLSGLARERIMGEMQKALLGSGHPSVFFGVLREMKQLSFWFPEVQALIGVQQDPLFHPEGDVWNHTMQVLDAAAGLRDQAVYPLGFMLAALAHDLGKPQTTQVLKGHIHSYGHEKAGVEPARQLIERLTDETRLREYVPNMVLLHMRPGALVAQQSSRKAYMKLYDEAKCPEDLILLAAADRLGSGGALFHGLRVDTSLLETELAEYRRLMAEPYVSAKDLAAAGLVPGPVYSRALAYAHKLHLSGVPAAEARAQTVAFARRLEKKTDCIDGSQADVL